MGTRSDSLLLGAMDASLSVQPQEGALRIQSRDGSGGVGRGRSVSGARPSWFRRALGGLLTWKHPAAVEAPAPARALERAPTERPRWRSSLKKAVRSALARMACVCKPACSGVHDDDVVNPRKRRRRRSDIRSGARSPPVAAPTGESEDDYWTFAIRGRSLTDDVLMRRFVLEEDTMRRRMEMRVAAGYGRWCWFPPGPSRLSQMSLADDDDEAGDNSSTSPQ